MSEIKLHSLSIRNESTIIKFTGDINFRKNGDFIEIYDKDAWGYSSKLEKSEIGKFLKIEHSLGFKILLYFESTDEDLPNNIIKYSDVFRKELKKYYLKKIDHYRKYIGELGL